MDREIDSHPIMGHTYSSSIGNWKCPRRNVSIFSSWSGSCNADFKRGDEETCKTLFIWVRTKVKCIIQIYEFCNFPLNFKSSWPWIWRIQNHWIPHFTFVPTHTLMATWTIWESIISWFFSRTNMPRKLNQLLW